MCCYSTQFPRDVCNLAAIWLHCKLLQFAEIFGACDAVQFSEQELHLCIGHRTVPSIFYSFGQTSPPSLCGAWPERMYGWVSNCEDTNVLCQVDFHRSLASCEIHSQKHHCFSKRLLICSALSCCLLPPSLQHFHKRFLLLIRFPPLFRCIELLLRLCR